VVASDSRVFFVADGLAEPPSGRTYQLWLLREGETVGQRVFGTDEGLALFEVSQSPGSFDKVMVTIEPSGGSEEPTTDLVLASN
jgi:hypothetical protein